MSHSELIIRAIDVELGRVPIAADGRRVITSARMALDVCETRVRQLQRKLSFAERRAAEERLSPARWQEPIAYLRSELQRAEGRRRDAAADLLRVMEAWGVS